MLGCAGTAPGNDQQSIAHALLAAAPSLPWHQLRAEDLALIAWQATLFRLQKSPEHGSGDPQTAVKFAGTTYRCTSRVTQAYLTQLADV